MMFEHSRRELGGALLLTLLAALAGWPSAVMAQREGQSLRSGEKSQSRTLQPPLTLKRVATTLRTMGRDDIARVEREIAAGTAADPRSRSAPRGTGAGSASTSTNVQQAEPGARTQSPFAGKYVGEIKGPARSATWACTVSSDGSFQGWFRHSYSQATGYEAILNGTVLADGEVNAAGTAKKLELSGTLQTSVITGSFPVSLSGKFAGGDFWGKVVGESEVGDATAERVVSTR